MAPQDPPPYTAFTGTDAPDTAAFNSMLESLMAGSTQPASFPSPAVASATDSPQPTNTDTAANISESPRPFTIATAPSSSLPSITSAMSPSATSVRPSLLSTAATSSVTNVASNADGAITKSQNCNSISCSPGLQAAVAVPVVIGVLAVVALNLFLVRRRRRNVNRHTPPDETSKKTWARHLRIFSFDNELVGGGRFSSSNSINSGQSLNGGANHVHNRDSTSFRSMDEVAPPYGESHNHAPHPEMSQTVGGLAAGGLAGTMIPRSTSRATAPPPYVSPDSRPQTGSTTHTSTSANPFSDTNRLDPADTNSPFQDPSEDGRSINSRPVISRTSSLRTGDENSSLGGSEAGSIREAQVVRHISISSGGPRITHIRNSSQGTPPMSSQGITPPASD